LAQKIFGAKILAQHKVACKMLMKLTPGASALCQKVGEIETLGLGLIFNQNNIGLTAFSKS